MFAHAGGGNIGLAIVENRPYKVVDKALPVGRLYTLRWALGIGEIGNLLCDNDLYFRYIGWHPRC